MFGVEFVSAYLFWSLGYFWCSDYNGLTVLFELLGKIQGCWCLWRVVLMLFDPVWKLMKRGLQWFWGLKPSVWWPFIITLIQGVQLELCVSPFTINIPWARQHLTQCLMVDTHSPFNPHVFNTYGRSSFLPLCNSSICLYQWTQLLYVTELRSKKFPSIYLFFPLRSATLHLFGLPIFAILLLQDDKSRDMEVSLILNDTILYNTVN